MKKLICVLALAALLGLCLPASAAGEVTDTLTVKVGYWGMETDRYVTVGSYHWSELERDLPLHYEAYSFYRAGTDGVYTTVIDSAYGFFLSDLLSYAGIYSGDVQSMQFYTKDQSVGYFTSFTYSELFATSRYFFADLAAQIHPVLDENGALTGYEANDAWNSCKLVQPMLALEDNWQSYEIGTEHTAPDYNSLGTGNRFRLLFGQSHPLEMRTNQTAKYTHTVFVTLSGSPELGALPTLDASIGSHEATLQVRVGNDALLAALADWLSVASSDESVLRILSVTVRPDPSYSDLATVEIAYEVLKEGEAALTVSLGDRVLADTEPVVVSPAPSEPAPVEPTPTEPVQPAPTEPVQPAPTEPVQPAPTAAQPDAASQLGPSEAAQPAPETNVGQPPDGQQPAELPEAGPPETSGPDAAGPQRIVLDPALAAQLAARTEAAQTPEEPAEATTVRLTLEPERDGRAGLLTAGLALLSLLLGAALSLRHYRKER